MRSKVFQANKIGIRKDAFMTEKSSEEVKPYKIVDITEDSATLRLMIDGDEDQERTITMNDLLHKWRVHKGKVTEKLEDWGNGTKASPCESFAWCYDGVKGAVFMACRKLFIDHESANDHLVVLQHPTKVKATKTFRVGALKLVAASTRLDRKDSKGAIPVCDFDFPEHGQLTLFMAPMFVGLRTSSGEASKTPWVAPFWLVRECDEEDDANMKLICMEEKVGNVHVKVPVLTNSKEIKAGDELLQLQLKATPPVAEEGGKEGEKKTRGNQGDKKDKKDKIDKKSVDVQKAAKKRKAK